MAERKRTLLVFSPGGMHVRSIRFRFWLVVLALILLVGGYAGYLIPFGHLTDNVVELNHKRNLAGQNKDLLQRILASFKMLGTLRAEIRTLDSQHVTIDRLMGVTVNPSGKKTSRKTGTTNLGLAGLEALARQDEELATALCSTIASGTSLFDSIPVLLPVPGFPSVTISFGKAIDPFTGTPKRHDGIDFVASSDTPVLAAAAGIISRVENSRQWGKRIVISHGYGFSTVYAHLGSVSGAQGRRVGRGEVIGSVGMSGLATGPHLHFEVWRRGVALNPAELFPPSADSTLAFAIEN